MNEQQYICYLAHMLDEAMEDKGNAMAKRLAKALQAKYDEFYTKYEDAEKLLTPFARHLRGKKILMPTDSPARSEMYLFMYENFQKFGLKELVAIGYGDDHMVKVSLGEDGKLKTENIPVSNNGDFRSGESLDAIDACDIMLGNPPFSQKLGPDFFEIPIQHGKDVIGIETPEKTTSGFFRRAIEKGTLTVYTCPYETFNVPIDAEGNRVRYDSGMYEDGDVKVYVFSTFSDVHEMKRKLAPMFAKARALGVRYEDLPECPCGPKADRVDIRVMYDYDTGAHANYTWIPEKPKADGIHRPLIAVSRFDLLGYNWERYFTMVGVKNIEGVLKNPRTGDDIISPKDGKVKRVNTAMYVFEYK